jgi:hypothetical protein
VLHGGSYCNLRGRTLRVINCFIKKKRGNIRVYNGLKGIKFYSIIIIIEQSV